MSPKEKRRRVRMATRKYQCHNMQMGLCAYCGEPTLHGRRSCEKCRDKRREDYDFYNAKRRLNYRADREGHRCVRCHKIMDVQWTFAQCADCLKKQRDGGRTNEQDDRDR